MSDLTHSTGQTITPDECGGNTLKIPGNWTNLPLYAGELYCFRYRFSPQYLKADAGGGARVLIHEGRLQLRSFIINFASTQHFKIEVTPEISGTTYTYTIGDDALALDSEELILQDDVYDAPVLSENDKVQIDLVNCSPYPSNFLSAAFTGEYAPRARRIG